MDPRREHELLFTRRQLFGRAALCIGTAALATMLPRNVFGAALSGDKHHGGLPGMPNFAPKAKRVIYLTMNGGPSQMDLWDYKSKLPDHFDQDLPDEIRRGQRITTM